MKGNAGFFILLVLAALLCAALFVLGRITLPGWIAALAVFCGCTVVRVRVLGGGFLPRLTLCLVTLAALAAVFKLFGPPLRPVPAVLGKDPKPTGVVTVAQGDLTGVYNLDGSVEVYTGIPYAAPPVGELRWREPQPAEPWEGVRVCDHFAPMSMQTRSSTVFSSLTELAVYHTFRPSLSATLEPMSEDSLYLNVWKPAGAQERLPVLIYIHGGSLTSGQPSWSEYNGESLAKKGVIVVNFGYRLNVFGYLATEQLAGESENGTTGNYGLLDQIAALRWVRENIAAFGGDPDQVTICGESAGASSVNALCVSPLSKGLFRRAIAESSGVTAKSPYHTFRPLSDALAMGQAILAEFGASSMDELRAVPAEKLVNTKHVNNAMTVDGWAITEQPYLTYQKGNNHEEALLHGSNVHESELFMLFRKVTKDNYVETLRPVLGEQAEAAAALCPAAPLDPTYHYIVDRGGEAKGSADRIYSAAWFGYSHYCWTRLLAAQGKNVWQYRFTKDNGSLGSCHGGELPYAFGCLDRHAWLYDDSDRALSEVMQSYWANFAKYGDPNGEGLPTWETTRDGRRVLELGEHVAPIDEPDLGIYALLDAYQDSVTAKWTKRGQIY